MVASIAARLATGSEPGSPRQVGHTWLFGGAPNVVGQPQNIFELVPSSTCTSSPITGSNVASASSYLSMGVRLATVTPPDAGSVTARPPPRSATVRGAAPVRPLPPHRPGRPGRRPGSAP